MRNEDAAATEAALKSIRRISDPDTRKAAARELELHYSRAVLTLRAVQDEAELERVRREAAYRVTEAKSRAALGDGTIR